VQIPLEFSLTPVVRFAIFSIISNPPNIVWQTFLEDLFPTTITRPLSPTEKKKANGHKPLEPTKTEMSKLNVLIKFILDQTFGAVLNTMMFLVFIGYVNAPVDGVGKGGAWDAISKEVTEKFWPILLDGYKVWPFYSLVSFLFIPVDKRIVVGCLVGVGWNIYLSLMVDS
jgi:hypothetical protein